MEPVRLQQYGTWLSADIQTPISLFLGFVGHKQGILLESAEVDGRFGRYSVIAYNFAIRLSCAKGKLSVGIRDQRLEQFKKFNGMPYMEGLRAVMALLHVEPSTGFEDLPPISRSLVGYFGYGVAGMFEPKLSKVLAPEDAESCMVLPGNVIVFDHLYNKLCFLTLTKGVKPQADVSQVMRQPTPPCIGETTATTGEAAYKKAVSDAIELIKQGECIQTVISSRFSAPFEGDPFVLYRRLRQINPSPYMFYMRLPKIELFGSSPEVMVRCRNGQLASCPIAGTRPRGESHAQDEVYAKELLEDPKERAEHVMLVDLGRNDLGRLAEPGSVTVDKLMQIERFSHVMHMTSYVSAKLRAGLDALDVLQATFPAGTVSGAPKIRAMEIIADLERLPRGPYAGAIGWMGLDEGRVDLDTGITIRSMWVRDNVLSWQAGAGIVFDSDPEKEWIECMNKSRVIRETLAGRGGLDVFVG